MKPTNPRTSPAGQPASRAARAAPAGPTPRPPSPPRDLPVPDIVDPALVPLLTAAAGAEGPGDGEASRARGGALRGRLLQRVASSRAAEAAMVTTRTRRAAAAELAPGVTARTLYAAADGRPTRPGEPLRARLVELQPGACWSGPPPGTHHEWLVLTGSVRLGDVPLQVRDYHVAPAGSPAAALASDTGALLFLRESRLAGVAEAGTTTVRDAEAGWPEFAPGIRRRVLWQHDGQAALLYWADAGATVPLHTHGHDEECLMVQGELFLDDVLLQQGDYQLAPAGTAHRHTETDTGVVIYAHGDVDLRFVG